MQSTMGRVKVAYMPCLAPNKAVQRKEWPNIYLRRIIQFENSGGHCFLATGRAGRQGFTRSKLSDFEEQFLFFLSFSFLEMRQCVIFFKKHYNLKRRIGGSNTSDTSNQLIVLRKSSCTCRLGQVIPARYYRSLNQYLFNIWGPFTDIVHCDSIYISRHDE